jgi:hypothetical protein
MSASPLPVCSQNRTPAPGELVPRARVLAAVQHWPLRAASGPMGSELSRRRLAAVFKIAIAFSPLTVLACAVGGRPPKQSQAHPAYIPRPRVPEVGVADHLLAKVVAATAEAAAAQVKRTAGWPVNDRESPQRPSLRHVAGTGQAPGWSPDHQIRRLGQIVQDCPRVAAYWADVPGLSPHVRSWQPARACT